jgi:hypothetical protein
VLVFSATEHYLFPLTDSYVLSIQSGVHIIIRTYFGVRGDVEERDVLQCIGIGGVIFFALVFLVLLVIPV